MGTFCVYMGNLPIPYDLSYEDQLKVEDQH